MALNKKVTVCLEELFNKLTADNPEKDTVSTVYGSIKKSIEDNGRYFEIYFDFKNDDGKTPCMDGETCEILEETEQYIVLQEIYEQIPFKLSKEEFGIAVICNC